MKILFYVFLCLSTKDALGKLIDLGHDLSKDSPVFPYPDFIGLTFNLTIMQQGLFQGQFWAAYNRFESLEHIGTHIDAPYHFNQHGWTLDQIPIERLITEAIMIDVTPKVHNNYNYEVSVEDVDNWIAANGPIPNNSVVLIRTGWSRRYPNATAYFGHATDLTKLAFPGMHPDAVRHIQSFKKQGINVAGFGIDGPSLDNGKTTNFTNHRLVAPENQYSIENMNNLDLLPAKGIKLTVLPMKIKGGSGGHARIIAHIPY